jgi:hypothetical protein
MRSTRRLVRIAVLGVTLAAIYQEMSKPEQQRTWTGKVMGLIPYDFRPPTWARLREAYWNPSTSELFTPRPLGIGWAINFYRAKELLTDAFGTLMGAGRPTPFRQYRRPGDEMVTTTLPESRTARV